MEFLDRLREGLSRTKQQILGRFDEIVKRAETQAPGAKAIDDDTVEALEELLISSDVGVAATGRIVTAVLARARDGESLRDLVKDEIRSVFDAVGRPVGSSSDRTNGHWPHVMLIVGVNGTGKTTTIGKLANLLEVLRQAASGVCRGHLPCGRGRATRDLGRARTRGHRSRQRGFGSGGCRVRRDSGGQGTGLRSDPGRHRRPAAHAVRT